MLEIKEITVNCAVSRNYQKCEFSMTATVECDEDIQTVKEMCRVNALQMLDNLPSQEQPKQPVQTSVQKPQYQAPRVNQQPVQNQGFNPQPRQQYSNNQYQVKPVSEAQIKYLKGLGYNGPIPQSWNEANQILQQLKAERGIA